VQELHAVYVGPSSLVVNLYVTPARADHVLPAGELVRRVTELRSVLLENPSVTQATITLTS
jgi:hypothetical protein